MLFRRVVGHFKERVSCGLSQRPNGPTYTLRAAERDVRRLSTFIVLSRKRRKISDAASKLKESEGFPEHHAPGLFRLRSSAPAKRPVRVLTLIGAHLRCTARVNHHKMVSRVAQLHVQILSVAFAAGGVGGMYDLLVRVDAHPVSAVLKDVDFCRLGKFSHCSTLRSTAHHDCSRRQHSSRPGKGIR